MRDFLSSEEFREYLEGIRDKCKKPFDCPKLVVLPEKIYAYDTDQIYEKGELICYALLGIADKSRVVKTHKCHLSNIEVILDKEIEAKCQFGEEKFKLKITNLKKVNHIN